MKLRTLLLLSTAGLLGLTVFTTWRSSPERRNSVTTPSSGLSVRIRPQAFPFQSGLQPPKAASLPLILPLDPVESSNRVSTVDLNTASLPESSADTAPAPYWQNWRSALLTRDVRRIPILGGQLAERLRQHPDSAIYQDMMMLLNDPTLSTEDKSLLIGLLGEVATTDALAILMLMAQENSNSPLYLASLQGISQIAGNRWGGRFHEELSAGLETAWQDLQSRDPAYASTLAKAIAHIGSPDGVAALFDSLTDPSRQSNVSDNLRLKQKSAFAAIPEIRNPAAIEVIGQQFRQNPIETPGFEVSGLALASMGSHEATESLLSWTETAPTTAASRVEDWFSKIQDLPSVEMLLARQSSLAFASTDVEAAFTRALNRLNPPLEEVTASIPQTSSPDQALAAPVWSSVTDMAASPPLSSSMPLDSEIFDVTGNDMAEQGATPLDRALESDFPIKQLKKIRRVRHRIKKKL